MRMLQKHLGPFPVLPFVVRKRVKVESEGQRGRKAGRALPWATAREYLERKKGSTAENKRSGGHKGGAALICYWQKSIGGRSEELKRTKGSCQQQQIWWLRCTGRPGHEVVTAMGKTTEVGQPTCVSCRWVAWL